MIINSTNRESEFLQYVYNGLDCVITRQVFSALRKQLDDETQHIYDFERDLQRVALGINLRGIRIDRVAKMQKRIDYENKLEPLYEQFHQITNALCGRKVNINSPIQMQHLFYTTLKCKVVRSAATGKPTVDEKALSSFAKGGGFVGLIARYALELRRISKVISTLSSEYDSDGRMRENINIGGTETGRWSSSKPLNGKGMSGQNITEDLREMFIADAGKVFVYVDLDQAESRVVGLASYRDDGRDNYLKACESGDIHTSVCRMAWSELEWSDDVKEARCIAEATPISKGSRFSYRDIAKRLGHGTNYLGTPAGMSYALKVPKPIIEDFQRRYFLAFPDLKSWHNTVAYKLQTQRYLTTMLSRKRHFFGRPYEKETIKEAVAYEPQSVVGDVTNIALLRLVRAGVVVCKNLHDGALMSCRVDEVDSTINKVREAFDIELKVVDDNGNSRSLVIPIELKVGYNWGVQTDTNKNGLRAYTGDLPKRVRGKSFGDLVL